VHQQHQTERHLPEQGKKTRNLNLKNQLTKAPQSGTKPRHPKEKRVRLANPQRLKRRRVEHEHRIEQVAADLPQLTRVRRHQDLLQRGSPHAVLRILLNIVQPVNGPPTEVHPHAGRVRRRLREGQEAPADVSGETEGGQVRSQGDVTRDEVDEGEEVERVDVRDEGAVDGEERAARGDHLLVGLDLGAHAAVEGGTGEGGGDVGEVLVDVLQMETEQLFEEIGPKTFRMIRVCGFEVDEECPPFLSDSHLVLGDSHILEVSGWRLRKPA
jgi:hypothetical protein